MQVDRHREELNAAGVAVIGIGFSSQARLNALARELGLGFPLRADPDRDWYRALAVPPGRWRAVLAPRILRRYAVGLLHRERIPLFPRDLRQLGAGALLRGPQVLHAWVTDESERRPSVAQVILAANRATPGHTPDGDTTPGHTTPEGR